MKGRPGPVCGVETLLCSVASMHALASQAFPVCVTGGECRVLSRRYHSCPYFFFVCLQLFPDLLLVLLQVRPGVQLAQLPFRFWTVKFCVMYCLYTHAGVFMKLRSSEVDLRILPW